MCQRGTADQPEQHGTLLFAGDASSEEISSGLAAATLEPAAAEAAAEAPPEAAAAPAAAGVDCSAACGSFAVPQYMAALTTASLGRVLLTAAGTASTQVVVQENVKQLPDGLVFVADKQYGGKGGHGRQRV